jgi:hypothetical protein
MTKKMGIQFFALPGEIFQFLDDCQSMKELSPIFCSILWGTNQNYHCQKYDAYSAGLMLENRQSLSISVQWNEPGFSNTQWEYSERNPNTFYFHISSIRNNALFESLGGTVWDMDIEPDFSKPQKLMKLLKKRLYHKRLKLVSSFEGELSEHFYSHWWYSKAAYEFQQLGGKIQPLPHQNNKKVVLEAPIERKRNAVNEKIALGEGDKTP